MSAESSKTHDGEDNVEVMLEEHIFLPGLPLLELNLDVRTDVLEVVLECEHHTLHGLALLLDRDLERERQPLAVLLHEPVGAAAEARLLQEGPCLFGIEGHGLHIEVIGPAPGRKGPGDDGPLAVEERVEHLLPVHGVGKGLAHALVREKRVPYVVPEERVRKRVVGLEDEAFVALNLGDVPRVDEHDHVDRIEHQRLGHDVLVGKGFGDELVDVRPALEVVFVRGEDDLALGGDVLQEIGAGADGVLYKRVFPREVERVARPVLRDHLEAELGQGVQDRPLQRKLDRVVIELLDRVDELVPHLEGRNGLGMHHDLVGEDHVVGRERLGLPHLPSDARSRPSGERRYRCGCRQNGPIFLQAPGRSPASR